MPTSNNILEYKDLWPSLIGTGRIFITTKITDLGSSLLDRDVTPDDVAAMQKIKLKDMEFIVPEQSGKDIFIIKDKENSIEFSNRASTRNEIRGSLLRERLSELAKTDGNLSLYDALEKTFLNIEQSDLFKGLMTSLYTEGKPVHPRYQKIIAEVFKSVVNDLRQNPNILDERLIEKCEEKTRSMLHERDGLELLEDTLGDKTEESKALGRVLLAMKFGDLSIQGQVPDSAYPLGEYLIHGGRIKFDLSELSHSEQKQFFDFITNKQATTRAFASHRAGGIDANGSPAEAKSGILGAISDAFRALTGTSKHFGINLSVGSAEIPNKEGQAIGEYPQANGEWGHMYLHKDDDIVLIGIEASAPGKKNQRTNEAHSVTGATGEKSPFMQEKINTKELREKQMSQGLSPLSTNEKNNWASVKISPGQFQLLKEIDNKLNNDYTSLARELPIRHAPAKPNRFADMEQWAKATKQGNKTHWAPAALKILGGLLAIAGMAVALIPIPGLAQLVGGWMTAVGIGVAAAAVGFGINRLGAHLDPGSNAPHIYDSMKAASKVEANKMESPSQDPVYNSNLEGKFTALDQNLNNSHQQGDRLEISQTTAPGDDKVAAWLKDRQPASPQIIENQTSSSFTSTAEYRKIIDGNRTQAKQEIQAETQSEILKGTTLN